MPSSQIWWTHRTFSIKIKVMLEQLSEITMVSRSSWLTTKCSLTLWRNQTVWMFRAILCLVIHPSNNTRHISNPLQLMKRFQIHLGRLTQQVVVYRTWQQASDRPRILLSKTRAQVNHIQTKVKTRSYSRSSIQSSLISQLAQFHSKSHLLPYPLTTRCRIIRLSIRVVSISIQCQYSMITWIRKYRLMWTRYRTTWTFWNQTENSWYRSCKR